MSSGMMPRLGPSIIRRQGLEEWLGRFRSVPVRFLVAPPGFGKSMALLGYLRHSATNGVYCALAAGANSETFWNAVARALQLEVQFGSHEEMVRALAARVPLELAIDCEDVPDRSLHRGGSQSDRRPSGRRLLADRLPVAGGLPCRPVRLRRYGGALRRGAARLRRSRNPARG